MEAFHVSSYLRCNTYSDFAVTVIVLLTVPLRACVFLFNVILQRGPWGGVQQLGHGQPGRQMVGGKLTIPPRLLCASYTVQGPQINQQLLHFQGVDLQKLILAHNNLEVLREDLRNLSSLVVLNISHNQISSLPAAIGEYVAVCPNSVISEIDADPYIIISLSDNLLLCSLPLLKSLDASFNQINTIPEEIGSATALVK